MKMSYIEDKNVLAYCFRKREYSTISEMIKKKKPVLSYSNKKKGSIIGYIIKKVEQLSNIYSDKFYSVEFYLLDVEQKYSQRMEKDYAEMMKHLSSSISGRKGYYIIKVPSEYVNLIDSFNKNIVGSGGVGGRLVFAGGTVCYSAEKSSPDHQKILDINDDIEIKMIDKKTAVVFEKQLVSLGESSFKDYSGQYHLSNKTRPKAPLVYRNWVKDHIGSLDEKRGCLLVALSTAKGKIPEVLGFLTAERTEYANEIILNAVKEKYREKKIYQRLVLKAMRMGLEEGKMTTVSTPFDNLFPQRAWINLGFKPYHSFYLFHYNNL